VSLFPTRLKPGGTVTIHLRSTARMPIWVKKKAFVVDPNGRKAQVFDLLQPFLPPPPQNEDDQLVEKEAGELYQTNPLLMAAVYLQREKEDFELFVQMLKGLRESTHHYTTYTLPAGAPLGKYRVELEVSLNGRTTGSGTAATDYFLVEELHLKKVVKRDGQREAHIENPSPEPCLVNLCEFVPGQTANTKYRTRLVNLEANQVTKIPFEGTAFLSYLGGTEILRLSSEKDPFCVRNPAAVPLPKPDGTVCVFLTKERPETGSLLKGEAAEIWKSADGFRTRQQIRNRKNAKSYDALVKAGLLLEVD